MSTKNENDRAYDVRVLERNVRKGVITRKDVDKYLKSLPDRTDNVAQHEGDAEVSSGTNGTSNHR